jgi:hypothetical protein
MPATRRLIGTLLALMVAFATADAPAVTVQPQSAEAVLGASPAADGAGSRPSHDNPGHSVSFEFTGGALPPPATEETGVSDEGAADFTGLLANGLARRLGGATTRTPSGADARARPAPSAGHPSVGPRGSATPDFYETFVRQAMLGAAAHPSLAFMFDPVFRSAHDQVYATTAGSAAGFSDFFVLGHRDASLMTLVTYGGHSGRLLEATVSAHSPPEPDWTSEQAFRGPGWTSGIDGSGRGSLILDFLDRYVWSVVSNPLAIGGFGLAALLWVAWNARNRIGGRRAYARRRHGLRAD